MSSLSIGIYDHHIINWSCIRARSAKNVVWKLCCDLNIHLMYFSRFCLDLLNGDLKIISFTRSLGAESTLPDITREPPGVRVLIFHLILSQCWILIPCFFALSFDQSMNFLSSLSFSFAVLSPPPPPPTLPWILCKNEKDVRRWILYKMGLF